MTPQLVAAWAGPAAARVVPPAANDAVMPIAAMSLRFMLLKID